MSCLSTTARSTRSSARKVLSSTPPDRVAQRRAHEGRALARLDVLEVDDLEQPLGRSRVMPSSGRWWWWRPSVLLARAV